MNPDKKAKTPDELQYFVDAGGEGRGREMFNASGTVTVMRIFRLFKKRLKLNLHLRFFYVSCS